VDAHGNSEEVAQQIDSSQTNGGSAERYRMRPNSREVLFIAACVLHALFTSYFVLFSDAAVCQHTTVWCSSRIQVLCRGPCWTHKAPFSIYVKPSRVRESDGNPSHRAGEEAGV